MTGPAPRVVGPRGATAEEVAEAPSVELLMNGSSRKRCRAPSSGRVLGMRYCRRGQRLNSPFYGGKASPLDASIWSRPVSYLGIVVPLGTSVGPCHHPFVLHALPK